MENDLRNRFPKNSAYNVYDQIYNVNPPPDNLLAQSSFSQPTGVKEAVEVGTKAASTGTMWAAIGVVGVVTAFTAVSAVIGYSYWNTTLNPFFSSTLTTILTNIALLFTNFTTVYNLAVSLNYTVGNLTTTNFTINGDAYFTNFNGSVPLFNTSASNVGVALNYLATNDNFMRNQINQILATPPSTPNAYSVSFNGSSPLFNTSASEVGSALNYLATNDNFMRNQINQILATPPSTPNAYSVTFNGSSPLFNTSASDVGSALNYLATNDNYMRNQINQILATPPSAADAYTTTFNGTTPLFAVGTNNVGSALNYLGTSNKIVRSRADTIVYVDGTYGDDATCDGSAFLPCATASRGQMLIPNVTSEFDQWILHMNSGLYVESAVFPVRANVVYEADETNVFWILNGGISLDPVSWAYSGTGYTSFLRFQLIRIFTTCSFDMSSAVPSADIFSVIISMNNTFELNTPCLFKRRASAGSYFGVQFMETVATSSGNGITFQDMTSIQWSRSDYNYESIAITYNSSATYSGICTTLINGYISHAAVSVNNYAPGLAVDVSVTGLVNRGAATFTINYLNGTNTVNTHGDILTFGSINGGAVNAKNAGTKEYLTLAGGLGVTLTTPGDWDAPLPVDQQEVNDQLAARARAAQGRSVTRGIGISSASPSFGSGSCTFNVNLNSGTLYILGNSDFAPSGGSSITFNGTGTHGFQFKFSAIIEYEFSFPVSTGGFLTSLVQKNGATTLATDEYLIAFSASFQTLTMTLDDVFFLNAGDSVDLILTITIPGSILSACTIYTGKSAFFSFEQFS